MKPVNVRVIERDGTCLDLEITEHKIGVGIDDESAFQAMWFFFDLTKEDEKESLRKMISLLQQKLLD